MRDSNFAVSVAILRLSLANVVTQRTSTSRRYLSSPFRPESRGTPTSGSVPIRSGSCANSSERIVSREGRRRGRRGETTICLRPVFSTGTTLSASPGHVHKRHVSLVTGNNRGPLARPIISLIVASENSHQAIRDPFSAGHPRTIFGFTYFSSRSLFLSLFLRRH